MGKQEKRARQGRGDKSLTTRLARGFFARQISALIWLDVLLALLACLSLLVWGEGRCIQAAELVRQHGLPSGQTLLWVQAGDYTVTVLERNPEGIPLTIDFLAQGSLENTAQGLRSTDLMTFYRLEMPGETPYAITADISGLTHAFFWGGLVILLQQLLALLTGTLGSRRAVRSTLRPLQDMAATAARLTSATHLSQREMEALAGELNKIGGQDLDSRIDLPTTQKELRTLAQAINNMLERVNHSYRAQMQFVSDASHELRTPIAVIQGYGALLDRWGKTDPEARQESIDAIRSEAKAMERLVEQLLFLARGDNDSQPVRMEEFDLAELAAEVLRDEILIHQQRSILPSWEGPILVKADPALIKQAMRILLDNSVKYSAEPERIWLRLSPKDGHIRITVQDEGMGIAPDALPHIFDRFYRTDSSRTRQTGGTGLGLSIARWIIQRHNGWIEVISRQGLGTRISFLIPTENSTDSADTGA